MPARFRDFFLVTFGTGALVTVVALLNNLRIASLSPRYFAVYHPDFFPISEPWQAAVGNALLAVGAPALAWGILLYACGCHGPAPALRVPTILAGVVLVVVLAVSASWGLGAKTVAMGWKPYPDFFYPVEGTGLVQAETVQLTNFIVGVGGAAVWLGFIMVYRGQKTPAAEASGAVD
jgi:hypothetical protein